LVFSLPGSRDTGIERDPFKDPTNGIFNYFKMLPVVTSFVFGSLITLYVPTPFLGSPELAAEEVGVVAAQPVAAAALHMI
jgi:hypothetical protein